MNPFIGLKAYVIYTLLIICAVLGAAAFMYRELYHHEKNTVDKVKVTLKQAQDTLRDTKDAIEAQKKEAAEKLAAINATVVAQQKRIDDAYELQEKTDDMSSKTLEQVRAELARMRATARRMQHIPDPGAGRGDGGGSANGQASAGNGPGAEDAAQAPGVLHVSEDPEAAADDDAYDADAINAAYASCRAQALVLRKLTGAGE